MSSTGSLKLLFKQPTPWIPLENGIEIQFAGQGAYRSGDYWLFPARTATAEVEWPREREGTPYTKPPDGIAHHYAPLAIIPGTRGYPSSGPFLAAPQPLYAGGATDRKC